MKLETYFPYLLASSAETFSRRLSRVYSQTYGLSREEWRLLFLLADAHQLTSLELSKRTTLDKVQVSRAAKRLEEKGLIARSIEQSDRRLRLYTCTGAGRQMFDEILPQVEASADLILESLSATDLAALKQGLVALRRAAQKQRP